MLDQLSLKELTHQVRKLVGELESLLNQAQAPQEALQEAQARLARADSETRKAVSSAVNLTEREWAWRVEKLELQHQAKVALLEQELSFLKSGKVP